MPALRAVPAKRQVPFLPMLSHLRPFVRDLTAVGLWTTGVTRPARVAKELLTVATFHRVLPAAERRDYPLADIAITPEEFAWFLDFFVAHYTPGDLACVHRRWVAGERPDKPLLAITFDDGQLDNYLHAVPLLEARGLSASFYVPVAALQSNESLWHDRVAYALRHLTSHDPTRARNLFSELSLDEPNQEALVPEAVERLKPWPPGKRLAWVQRAVDAAGGPQRPSWDGMMTWDHLREMAKRGHEIGSHSVSHDILTLVDDAHLERELVDSKRILEEQLQRPVETMCYPNGNCDARVAAATQKAGYLRAVTTKWGPIDRSTPVFELTRCDIQSQHARLRTGALSPERMAYRLSPLFVRH
jgi:peptidoglycan/xylan/chitin deacetylase (PgdA/CDA1 family)